VFVDRQNLPEPSFDRCSTGKIKKTFNDLKIPGVTEFSIFVQNRVAENYLWKFDKQEVREKGLGAKAIAAESVSLTYPLAPTRLLLE
jgi:hypothetical protein